MNKHFILLYLCLFIAVSLRAQKVEVRGVVYNHSKIMGLPKVLVRSNSGATTITDSTGAYTLWTPETDSIFFTYQGKTTRKYAVADIKDKLQFSLSLHNVEKDYIKTLAPVVVRAKTYKEDSLSYRDSYKHILDRQKGLQTSVVGSGVGLDVNSILTMFKFRQNKLYRLMEMRLLTEEQNRYIDYRFNAVTVKRITNMPDYYIPKFLKQYRPDYLFLQQLNDVGLASYILNSYYVFAKTYHLSSGTF